MKEQDTDQYSPHCSYPRPNRICSADRQCLCSLRQQIHAHIRLVGIVEVVVLIRQSPHKCRVVLGLPHEVARGGIPLCGQFHVGIEGLSAVRHVSPSGMFFLPLWTTAGVYGYPDVADGKNRLEEEINFSQRFTTALTWCFSTHATPSCLRALFSS